MKKTGNNAAKGRKKNRPMQALIVVLILVAAFSLYKVISIALEYKAGSDVYQEAQELVIAVDENDEILSKYKVDFETLRDTNSQVQGWLVLPDSKINYPVVQGSDNQKYLTRLYTGEINSKGSLFIDFRCEENFNGHKTVVYGHHMKDGSMFAGLLKYRKQSYYEKHPYMVLVTPEATYKAEIFAAMTLEATDELYNASKKSKEASLDEIKEIKNASDINAEVTVKHSDKILLLSTCAYDFDDARYAVFAKLSKISDKEEGKN